MLQAILDTFYRMPQTLQRPFNRGWYALMGRLDRDADMTFMNYGWAAVDAGACPLPLQAEDEPNRYPIQLYHHVAGAVDLHGQDVLEIGCGRGGGAGYVARYLGPRTVTGLDLTGASIAFCRRHYAIRNLTFVQGRAEALRFAPESFDRVVNVESSHCYGDIPRFLSGVCRTLRPGGYFLFADHRDRRHVDTLRRQLAGSGLTVVKEENINANVVKALELDDARKQALIRRKVPRPLQRAFGEFAGMEGTHSSRAALETGDKVYLACVLRKEHRG